MENSNEKPKRRRVVDLSMMQYGKVPPQAKELEEAILGAIMLERKAFDTANEILTPTSFYVDAHQKIFAAERTGMCGQCRPLFAVQMPNDGIANGSRHRVGSGVAADTRPRLTR